MYSTPDQTARAEGALLGGAQSGNWQAAGLALVCERLDAVIDRLDAFLSIDGFTIKTDHDGVHDAVFGPRA